MTSETERIAKLEEKASNIESKVDSLDAKMDSLINKVDVSLANKLDRADFESYKRSQVLQKIFVGASSAALGGLMVYFISTIGRR